MFGDRYARLALAPGRFNVSSLLLGWALAEIVAFALVVKLLGFGGAVLLSLAASLLGLIMIRRLGFDVTRRLRAALAGGAPPEGALFDGMLEGLGAVLLILPGFVSDIVGLALATPSIRAQLASRLGGDSRHGATTRPVAKVSPDIIDLAPSDWRVVDRSEPR